MRNTHFLSLLILITVSFNSPSNGRNSDYHGQPLSSEEASLEGLQRHRTRRMIWLDKKRQLILPPDTSLGITSMLSFPMLKQSSTWVSFDNFQIVWTFYILFQGLGWTSPDNAWPLDISFLIPNMTTPIDTPRRRNGVQCDPKFSSSSCANDIPIMAFPPQIPGGDRATLIPQLERLLSSFGLDGRACLQRVVCEIHEIPLKDGFGLLGELLTLFFSISNSTYAKSHLPEYLNAEKAGLYGDCSSFNRKCPYSIFTSK